MSIHVQYNVNAQIACHLWGYINDMHAMHVGSKIVYMYVYVQLYASLLLLYLKYH